LGALLLKRGEGRGGEGGEGRGRERREGEGKEKAMSHPHYLEEVYAYASNSFRQSLKTNLFRRCLSADTA